MLVREMKQSELDAVVELCVAGSEPTSTSVLGPRYLRSQFSAFLDSQQGCALTCWDVDRGELVGYVCGTQDLAKHYRSWFRRNFVRLLPLLAIRLVTPGTALVILRRSRRLLGIVRFGRAKDSTLKPLAPSPAILMQVLVRTERRRQKVGTILVKAFADEMARRGAGRIELWVRAENGAARRLYEHLGWIPVRCETLAPESTRWLYRLDFMTTGESPDGDKAGEVSNVNLMRVNSVSMSHEPRGRV